MIKKIEVIFEILLLYLLGYRPYELFAKWRTFNNEVYPFDVVLLKKGTDLRSGEALSTAIDQMVFTDLFKANYTFDHFEPASLRDYIDNQLLWC